MHYELNRALMMDRRTARHTSIPVRALKSGAMTAEQRATVASVRPRLLAWDGEITYLHTPGWTMERTIAELRSLQADGRCDVAVIDYLEKASPSAATATQTNVTKNWLRRWENRRRREIE